MGSNRIAETAEFLLHVIEGVQQNGAILVGAVPTAARRLGSCTSRLSRNSRGGSLLAALCAYATFGITDTLLDAPRFLLLWLLLCLLPSALPISAAPAARAAG